MMNRQQAEREIFSRYRDFGAWTGDHSPASQETPLDVQVQYIRERFPQVKRNDPGAWKQGGWKRVELEEALSILGLKGLGEEPL